MSSAAPLSHDAREALCQQHERRPDDDDGERLPVAISHDAREALAEWYDKQLHA